MLFDPGYTFIFLVMASSDSEEVEKRRRKREKKKEKKERRTKEKHKWVKEKKRKRDGSERDKHKKRRVDSSPSPPPPPSTANVEQGGAGMERVEHGPPLPPHLLLAFQNPSPSPSPFPSPSPSSLPPLRDDSTSEGVASSTPCLQHRTHSSHVSLSLLLSPSFSPSLSLDISPPSLSPLVSAGSLPRRMVVGPSIEDMPQENDSLTTTDDSALFQVGPLLPSQVGFLSFLFFFWTLLLPKMSNASSVLNRISKVTQEDEERALRNLQKAKEKREEKLHGGDSTVCLHSHTHTLPSPSLHTRSLILSL
jgi:hypothetical protein